MDTIDVILQALLDEQADITAKLAAAVGLQERLDANTRMIAIRRGEVPVTVKTITRAPRSPESIAKGQATWDLNHPNSAAALKRTKDRMLGLPGQDS